MSDNLPNDAWLQAHAGAAAPAGKALAKSLLVLQRLDDWGLLLLSRLNTPGSDSCSGRRLIAGQH